MRLAPGTNLGPYSIVSPLGAGGMGEVYRARDNRLDREVALKILSAEFAADPDRLQRFGREAQTLAALNHPHTAQIYGLEDTGDGHALVMELVDGEDLAARVARGPMAIDDLVSIAEQLAEGKVRPSSFFVVCGSRRTTRASKSTWRHWSRSTSLGMRQPVMYPNCTAGRIAAGK